MKGQKLNAILDEDGDITMEQEDTLHHTYAEEHIKRIQAEADAETHARRCDVARQQFAEWASDKALEGENLLKDSNEILSALSEAAQSLPEDVVQGLLSRAQRLHSQLSAMSHEAKSTADQLHEESRKRTFVESTPSGKRLRENDEALPAEEDVTEAASFNGSADSFVERAKYIPLRLTPEERRLLRLLEGALHVNEYTDRVDILSYRSKSARVYAQIKDLCSILCGLAVAQDFKAGQRLLADREFSELVSFFQNAFEVGRRYKVCNPDKMRDTYGKLMYCLMDSGDAEIIELLGFRCTRSMRTVYTMLQESNALALLSEPALEIATAEIAPPGPGRTRAMVQRDIKTKETARERLARKYRSDKATEEDLLRAMYSISDNNSFLAFARDPVDRMIVYLQTYFKPDDTSELSLAIRGGSEGARLTHSHSRQYAYVLQSLSLWREISHHMFKLWCLAEEDMLDEHNKYRLQNTGQGLQRVQSAPRVARAMADILATCQRRIGSWVGSSVVHLGDHNVPNALIFIDKYTQVPRILNPLVLVLDELPRLARDPKISAYIEQSFGSIESCRKIILCDFFRHAFDGSGADNFFDAGSCIDGRLTSAWNWCSKVEKKAYWPLFKLAGFTGFDGDFK